MNLDMLKKVILTLKREETVTTYMGLGVAIPHGTGDAKKLQKTGIVMLQYPEGMTLMEKKHS